MSTMHEFDPNYPRPTDTPKFTPGPWKFTPWHVEEDNSTVRAPDGWIICHTSSDANARLIAAAPDLYNALLALAYVADAHGIPVDAARAALAKAVQP